MLWWQAVIGKMVGFMSSKLATKWVDLTLDQRKRACRAFVKLYFAMENLEEITSELLKHLEEIQKGAEIRVSGASLSYISEMVHTNTQVFLDSVRDLGNVIELFDPVLSAELVQLSDYKASFLMAASETFNVDMDESNQTISIRYEKPVDKFLTIDFCDVYEWLKKRENLYDVRDVFEWPQEFVVRYFIEEGDIESSTLRIDNKDDVMKFDDALKGHSTILADGTERLRSLIIGKFSPEDILYVNKRLD